MWLEVVRGKVHVLSHLMIPRLNKSVRRIDDGVLEVVRIQIISVVRRIVLESLSEGGVKNVLILPL